MKGRIQLLMIFLLSAAFVVLPAALGLTLALSEIPAADRIVVLDLLKPRVPLIITLLLAGSGFAAILVHGRYQDWSVSAARLADAIRLMLTTPRAPRPEPRGPRAIQDIARSANDLAQQRDELLDDVQRQISQAKASVEEEKNRLAALMSELAQSVVVCNLDGRILLYNARARLQFRTLGQGAAGSGALIGLGRSVFAIFERGQIAHALDHIRHRLKKGGTSPVANFVTTTRAGQLLRVQMAPVLSGGDNTESPTERAGSRRMAGYVLTLENITATFEQEAKRDHLLTALTEGSRASLASVRAAVENLVEYPDMDPGQRERFVRIVSDEVGRMSKRLDEAGTRFADALKTRWPLEEMLGADLLAAAMRRVETRLKLLVKTEQVDPNLWVKVDSFALIQALTYLCARLHDEFDIREARFRFSGEGRLAYFDLIWTGPPISSDTIYMWELEPMSIEGEVSPLTLRDVKERHGGEIWFQREKAAHRAFCRIVVPVAAPQEDAMPAEEITLTDSRPEYYDFDLFHFNETDAALFDRPLTELAYTVFDTETTGLQPSEGDEIIQIGAARIVNNRLLRTEVIDQLIDPQRRLRPESIAIHGISQSMLDGQPTIDAILPEFHAFAGDTVLVAHNAAFDMRFLQIKEAQTGVRFSQPVLDTLLLSAVVHPNQESHKLEAIAERFGITVIGRHTALGDSIVTAEVFLRIIPLLAEMGITTLRQALEASEKTYYARIKY